MDQEEIILDKYLRAIWRAKWLIILGVILAGAAAAYIASRQPTLHKATASIKIGRVWKEQLEDPYITERVINNPGFLKEVAAKAGLGARNLKRSVHAETEIAGPRRARYPILVNVTATTESAGESARLAQAVADEVIARHEELFNQAMKPHLDEEHRLEEREKEFAAQGSASRELLLKVESELNEVKANNSLQNPSVTEKTHLIAAVAASGEERPSVWRKAAVAAFVAAALLVAAAALVGHFRPAKGRAASANQS